MLQGGLYAWDPLAPLYLLSAVLVAGIGAGLMLFERFTISSRRFFVLTLVIGAWLAPLGMVRAAADPHTEDFWLRMAYVFLPFTLPTLHWVVLAVAAVGRSWASRGLWLAATGFAASSLAGPWLVDGLERVTRGHTLMSGGWIGACYLVFEVTAIVLTARRLVQSRTGALSGGESQQKLMLAAASLIGTMSMLDYVLPTESFRAGWLTPISILVAVSLVALSAFRFRMFAPGQSFATDEVLRTMADAVLVCDSVGRVRGSNPAACELLGQSESRLLGRSVSEFMGRPDSGAGAPESGWSPEPDVARSDLLLEFWPRSGPPVAVSVSTRPIQFGARNVGAVVVARDIRDRIRSERALQATELRYRALFHHNPANVFEVDTNGVLVRLNPAGRRMFGLGEGELEDVDFRDLVDPAELDRATASLAEVLDGHAQEFEIGVMSAVDGRRVVRGFAVPVRDGDRVVGSLGVAMDITEETRAKRELEIQRQYFVELFESAPEAVVLVGADGEIRRVNGEFTRLFGYSREEALGQGLDPLIVPDELRDEAATLTGEAMAGGPTRAETRRRRREGGEVEVSVLARKIEIPGEPPQMYVIYRDITERREAERQLREREEELRHAHKLEAVGKLAGGIAHDFNNLVTVINGHAHFALEEMPSDHCLRPDLEEIEQAGRRAAALTQQLLAFSRRQVLRARVLDLNDVVADLHKMLTRLIGEHIRLRTRIGADDAHVRVDRGQLEQVIMNLVVNARDAMPDGGTLTVETDALVLESGDPHIEGWELEPGRYVRLRVHDTGVGMDGDTADRAFEPFFTTKERGKGTGLGLATVFGIVKQSGGHVSVHSRTGEGTTFAVVLPVADESVETVLEDARAEREPAASEGLTVLVVEDEDAVRKLAVRVLERRGYRVLAAADGVDALSLVEEHGDAIDVILSDIVMPRMGGRELAAALGTRLPGVPVVFMSGYDEELVAERSDATIRDFVAKPFTPKALADQIAATARRVGRIPTAG